MASNTAAKVAHSFEMSKYEGRKEKKKRDCLPIVYRRTIPFFSVFFLFIRRFAPVRWCLPL